MSTTAKVLIGIVVLVLIGAGIYYYTKTPAAAPANTAELPSGSDTSDAALDKDMQSMDAQMSAFSQDNASIDSGLNDQQVQQSSL
jgi:hypothetical protein